MSSESLLFYFRHYFPVHVTSLYHALRLPSRNFFDLHHEIGTYETFCLTQILRTGQLHTDDLQLVFEFPSRPQDLEYEKLRVVVLSFVEAIPPLLRGLRARYGVFLESSLDTSEAFCTDVQAHDVLEELQKRWHDQSWAWLKQRPERSSLYTESCLKRFGLGGKVQRGYHSYDFYIDFDKPVVFPSLYTT